MGRSGYLGGVRTSGPVRTVGRCDDRRTIWWGVGGKLDRFAGVLGEVRREDGHHGRLDGDPHTYAESVQDKVWAELSSRPEWQAWLGEYIFDAERISIVFYEERYDDRIVVRGDTLRYVVPVDDVVARSTSTTCRTSWRICSARSTWRGRTGSASRTHRPSPISSTDARLPRTLSPPRSSDE